MADNGPASTEKGKNAHFDIAIIGGGIAGLYCAMMYGGKKSIALFEKTERVGGRIWTEYFPNEITPEFLAEFGPMRIQPTQQKLLSKLLDALNIRDPKDPRGEASGDPPTIFLSDFPAYASPPETDGPTYNLTGDESEQIGAIDLLQLAFVRILGRLTVDASAPSKERKALQERLRIGREELTLALATRQKTWKGAFERWVNGLEEEDYQRLRAYALFEIDKDNSYPLWLMGFWNLMAEVLSHNALTKLRVQGHFNHTIEENPNAAEWLIAWLRGLKTSRGLKGIHGGMHQIARRMREKIDKGVIRENHELVRLEPHGASTRLIFKNSTVITATHVVLALPKRALEPIVAASRAHFEDIIVKHINSVFPVPLLKLFVIVKDRWWSEKVRTNYNAGNVPTRELHYWPSAKPESNRGMILIYTDRPNSAFWANYLPEVGGQTSPVWKAADPTAPTPSSDSDKWLPIVQEKRLLQRITQYIVENGVPAFKIDDIEHYGIRDWSREPYGGGIHAWWPERKSWEALGQLSCFRLKNANANTTVHICGEAYSDYQGFMEGALRSAAHVLYRIDKKLHSNMRISWLRGS